MDQNHKSKTKIFRIENNRKSSSILTRTTKYENHDFALIALVGVKVVLFPSSQNKEYMEHGKHKN